MQAAAVATLLIAGGSQAISQIRAGQQAEVEYKERAQQELDAARDREIERRRRLVSALASQNAEAGALGAMTGFGSRAAIALSDARRASLDSLTDRASTNRRALMLRSAGAEARRQSYLGAATTLFETASQTIRAWPGKT